MCFLHDPDAEKSTLIDAFLKARDLRHAIKNALYKDVTCKENCTAATA